MVRKLEVNPTRIDIDLRQEGCTSVSCDSGNLAVSQAGAATQTGLIAKPPTWLPKTSLIMAEHSICQPGRPRPQGDSQAGSPALLAFHNAKSDGERLSESERELSEPSPVRRCERA
eukprot:scaffold227162_cov30-Tisochrysis_lutea.AAC.4